MLERLNIKAAVGSANPSDSSKTFILADLDMPTIIPNTRLTKNVFDLDIKTDFIFFIVGMVNPFLCSLLAENSFCLVLDF